MIEFSLTISSVFSASLHRLTQTTSQDTLLQSTGKVTLVMQKSFCLPLHVSVLLGSLPITSIYSVVSLNSALLETSGCSLARLVSFASAKSNSWRALGEKKKIPNLYDVPLLNISGFSILPQTACTEILPQNGVKKVNMKSILPGSSPPRQLWFGLCHFS